MCYRNTANQSATRRNPAVKRALALWAKDLRLQKDTSVLLSMTVVGDRPALIGQEKKAKGRGRGRSIASVILGTHLCERALYPILWHHNRATRGRRWQWSNHTG